MPASSYSWRAPVRPPQNECIFQGTSLVIIIRVDYSVPVACRSTYVEPSSVEAISVLFFVDHHTIIIIILYHHHTSYCRFIGLYHHLPSIITITNHQKAIIRLTSKLLLQAFSLPRSGRYSRSSSSNDWIHQGSVAIPSPFSVPFTSRVCGSQFPPCSDTTDTASHSSRWIDDEFQQ